MAVVRVLASFQCGAVLIWPWCTSFLLVKFVAGSCSGQRVFFSRFSDHYVHSVFTGLKIIVAWLLV